MSSFHLELLDNERQRVFRQLASFRGRSVLGGGTALSLQIGHRYSFDFDLFFTHPITQADRSLLKDVLSIQRQAVEAGGDQWSVITTSGVNVTLLFYPFADLFPRVMTEFLPIKTTKDIALDKARAIGRRNVWRDYVDLYFILKQGMTLKELVRLATRKFGVEFNTTLFLKQLTYFNDLEMSEILFIDEKPTSTEIQTLLQTEAHSFTDEQLCGR